MQKRIREKELLIEIKGLLGCSKGLFEVRCLNSIMVVFFLYVMKGFPRKKQHLDL